MNPDNFSNCLLELKKNPKKHTNRANYDEKLDISILLDVLIFVTFGNFF